MGDRELSVKITVDAEGFVKTLRGSAKDVDEWVKNNKGRFREHAEATKHAGEALEDLGHKGKEAEGGIAGLTEKFREFGGEQRSEGRFAGFLAAQIAQMGISSKSAAGEITGLVSAFAFGGGLGVAIETVKMMVEKFNELGAEEREAKKALDEYAIDAAKSLNSLWAQQKEQIYALSGATKAQVDEHRTLAPYLEEERLATVAVAEAAAKVAAAKKIAAGFEEAITEQDLMQQAAEEGAVRTAEKQLEEANKLLEAKKRTTEIARDQQEAATMAELNLPLPTKPQVDESVLKGMEAQREATELLMRIEKSRNDDLFRQYHGQASLEAEAAEQRRKIADDNQKMAIEEDRRQQELSKKSLDEWKKKAREQMQTAKELGSAIGSAFAEMATHSKSLTEIVKSMASEALGAMAHLAEESIENSALAAGGNAAAAAAATPIVGPALAVGAIAEMTALVRGLLGGIHSASGGFDIAAGVNPITQLHAREMVLPAHIAQPLRESIRGGSFGGGSSGAAGGAAIHNHFHAMDEASAAAFFNKHQGKIIKTIVHAMKNGRAA